MAQAYGFRNIQNLVQKMKRKRCDYDFVEVMACPGGCLNGGAQCRPDEGKETSKEMVAKLEEEVRVAAPPPGAGTRLFFNWCDFYKGNCVSGCSSRAETLCSFYRN